MSGVRSRFAETRTPERFLGPVMGFRSVSSHRIACAPGGNGRIGLALHSRKPGYPLGFHRCEVPAMSFELILPFLRPIEALLLDEDVSEIMGNADASW
jgi:hypothetical protein